MYSFLIKISSTSAPAAGRLDERANLADEKASPPSWPPKIWPVCTCDRWAGEAILAIHASDLHVDLGGPDWTIICVATSSPSVGLSEGGGSGGGGGGLTSGKYWHPLNGPLQARPALDRRANLTGPSPLVQPGGPSDRWRLHKAPGDGGSGCGAGKRNGRAAGGEGITGRQRAGLVRLCAGRSEAGELEILL